MFLGVELFTGELIIEHSILIMLMPMSSFVNSCLVFPLHVIGKRYIDFIGD